MSKYWISPDIKWRTFKTLNDRLYKGLDSGPKPKHADKILWQMLRDRQINLVLDTKQKDDPIIITLKNPIGKIKFIK